MTKNELFYQIDYHLQNDIKPSINIDELSKTLRFREYPFSILLKQKQTKQWKKYHPEGNVWNHTLLVIDQAAKIKNKSKNPRVFMWAAFLHDIGKPETTVEAKNKITAYNHEKIGEKLAEEFLTEFDCDEDFINQVKSLIRWHMQILFVTKSSKFADISHMLKQTDAEEVALLGYCDRMGRTNANIAAEQQNIQLFMDKVRLFNQ